MHLFGQRYSALDHFLGGTMVRLRKTLLLALMALLLGALPACAAGQTAQPTSTAVNLNAVMTSAAATAFVQLTQIAAISTPTTAPTVAPTLASTQALVLVSTNTPASAVETPASLLPTSTLLIGGETPTLQPGVTAQPSFTPVRPVTTPVGPICKNSAWTGYETIPDYTVFKPWEKFYKIWRFQNTGTCTWDDGFAFKMWNGANMGGDNYFIVNKSQFVKPGDVVDIGIKMFAPGEPGEYISHWIMVDDQGKAFGADVTVVIKVVK
jgi:hypothetical protein